MYILIFVLIFAIIFAIICYFGEGGGFLSVFLGLWTVMEGFVVLNMGNFHSFIMEVWVTVTCNWHC